MTRTVNIDHAIIGNPTKYITRSRLPSKLINANDAWFIVDSITDKAREARKTQRHALNYTSILLSRNVCTRSYHPTKQENSTPTKGGLHSTMAQCYLFDVLPPCCVFPILPETFFPPLVYHSFVSTNPSLCLFPLLYRNVGNSRGRKFQLSRFATRIFDRPLRSLWATYVFAYTAAPRVY